MAKVIRRDPRSQFNKTSIYFVIACPCGAEVHCRDSWSNGCDCGRFFNGRGQELAPRSQWGEETGEVFA